MKCGRDMLDTLDPCPLCTIDQLQAELKTAKLTYDVCQADFDRLHRVAKDKIESQAEQIRLFDNKP